jgi:FKBP12-rapamycin complex-associated protein
MKVLRDNKDSLMAVLEAFVYDPLINWRLMQAEPETRPPDGTLLDALAEVFSVTDLLFIQLN